MRFGSHLGLTPHDEEYLCFAKWVATLICGLGIYYYGLLPVIFNAKILL